MSRVQAAIDQAEVYRSSHASRSHLWTDDRHEFLRQFLKYGHVPTEEEIEAAGTCVHVHVYSVSVASEQAALQVLEIFKCIDMQVSNTYMYMYNIISRLSTVHQTTSYPMHRAHSCQAVFFSFFLPAGFFALLCLPMPGCAGVYLHVHVHTHIHT